MSVEIEQLVQDRFPGVELASEVRGWAFLEQLERDEGVLASLPPPPTTIKITCTSFNSFATWKRLKRSTAPSTGAMTRLA